MGSNRVVAVVTFLVNVLQIMYGSKPVSPLDTHPNIMLISISTFLLYCFACYFEHYISIFRSSAWPALVIYTNLKNFLGFISIVSFVSIIFSTSSKSLAIVYLFSSIFFTGKSVLNLVQNRSSSFAVRRSKNYSTNMRDNKLTDHTMSMGEHDMVHMKSMVELKFPFGRVNEILDVELGLGTHNAALAISSNFRMGEEKDGPKTRSSKKVSLDAKTYKELFWQRRVSRLENELRRKHKECMSLRGEALAELEGEVDAKKRLALPQKGIVINGEENGGIVMKQGFPQDNQMASTKGKSKMVGEKLYNNNGLWSQEAIAAVEKGKKMNKKLGKTVLNLEDKVIENVSLADWLEKATHEETSEPGVK